MVTMKNLKDMLQIFQKEKKLMNLDGFTLIFFFFTDILNQEFNLREKNVDLSIVFHHFFE